MGVRQPMQHCVDLRLNVGHASDVLCHRFYGGSLWRDLNPGWPEQKLIGQSLHTLREGGAEKKVLSLVGNDFQDVSELRHEPHVHHAVSFVEHHGVDFPRAQCAAEVKLHESAWCGNDDFGSGFKDRHLGFGAHTSDQGNRTDVRVHGKRLCRTVNLKGEFFGGNQDYSSRLTVLPAAQFLKDGEEVGTRFAGAGLSDANQVLSCEDPRDGLCLDWRWKTVAQRVNGVQKLPLQLEVLKRHCSKVGAKLSCGMIQDGVSEARLEEMAPFSGEEATEVLSSLLQARNWQDDLARMIPESDAVHLVRQWSEVNSVSAFQELVVKPFLESLMAQTTQGVTWNFQEDALAKGMLFLSNHRDIVLDPSLVNVALMDHGRKATEIGIGSNLLSSPWVRQLVKLNRCFVVERSGSARERYNHSLDTAAYIQRAIQLGTPVWLAHREGRAKDGRDTTAPALIRTLSSSGDESTWNDLKTVPVSISYEWDPCDAFKVNELLHLEMHGAYQKSSGEDERSMWTGLVGQKGQVHLEFGRVFEWPQDAPEVKPERHLAHAFDRQLIRGMKVWANQILAAEALALNVPAFASGVVPSEQDRSVWNLRKSAVEDALVERGWSREQSAQRWCQMLVAPLEHRATLLED